jgi:hypothetical protein
VLDFAYRYSPGLGNATRRTKQKTRICVAKKRLDLPPESGQIETDLATVPRPVWSLSVVQWDGAVAAPPNAQPYCLAPGIWT